jgi:hypothetical protein
VKKNTWILLGAAALGLYVLSRRTSAVQPTEGGGGAPTGDNGLFDWLRDLLGTAGSTGQLPVASDLIPSPNLGGSGSSANNLAAQLRAAGATAAAVKSGIVGTAIAQPGSYWISPQGGIVKSNYPSALTPRGGFEAISPGGLGYSTANPYIANNISRGLPAVAPPVYQGTMYVAGQGFVSTKGTVFK